MTLEALPIEVISPVLASGVTALGMWLRSRVRGATTAARVAREATETRTAEWQAIIRATNALNVRLEARLVEREEQLTARTSEVRELVAQLHTAEMHIGRLERDLVELRAQVEAMGRVTAEYRAAAQGRLLASDLSTGPTDTGAAADESTPVEGILNG